MSETPGSRADDPEQKNGSVANVGDDEGRGVADLSPSAAMTPSASSPPASASSPPVSPSPPPPSLTTLIGAARRSLVRAAFAEAAAAALAGAVLAVVIAAVVVGTAPFSAPLRNALLALVAVAGVGAAAVVVLRRALPLQDDLVAGRALEDALRRRGVDVRGLVRGALELRDASVDDDAGRSRALCDAHIARAARTLVDGDALSSVPGVGLERAVPTLLWLALGLTLLGGWAALSPASLQARLAKLVDDGAAAQALAARAAQQAPLVTDLTITLRFPAYMARADEVIPGSSGDITAPRGTEVLLAGRADRLVRSAALLVTGGEKELALDTTVTERRNLQARFVVQAAGAWRFRLEEDDGDVTVDPVAHKILVKPDGAPSVRLEEPASDRVVQPDEDVDVAFVAEDDFGITKVRVVVKRQGGNRAPFEKDLLDGGGLRQARGKGRFSIADTGARPGETLAVTVEAVDNDDVSGPNVGRSATRVLTVFSAAKHHEEVIARLDALKEQMVEVLGDELEAPFVDAAADAPALTSTLQARLLDRHRQMAARAAGMMKLFDETLTAIAKDERADDGVRRALANMRLELSQREGDKRAAVERTPPPVEPRTVPPALWQRLSSTQVAFIERLEKDILYLDDLVQRERVQQAQKLVADMKAAQQDLKSLLQQYKDSGDPQTRDALLDEIRKMQEQLGQLAAKLAELRREIPDEHLNEEAFRGDEMFQKASSLDEMIEEGRLDDAAAALEQMLEQTQKMVDELEKTGDEIGGEDNKALREKLERFGDELKALEEAQKQQLAETEDTMEQAARKLEEKSKAKIDAAIADALKKAEKAERALKRVPQDGLTGYEEEDVDGAKAGTSDLQRALQSGDVDDALRAVEAAEAAARSATGSLDDRVRGRMSFATKETRAARDAMQEASDALGEARRALQEAMPDPSSALGPRERDKLGKQADRQEQLGEQAQKLAQLLGEIGKDAPIFGPEHKRQLQDAQQAMQRAGQQLKGQSRGNQPGGLRGARQSQSQALQQLQALQQAMEQMAKNGGQGGGLPMPLPGGGAPQSEGSKCEDGQRGHSKEDVKIPDGSDFKVKDAFRKDILDAMRESAPGEWAGEVKKYYEELIK
jgi:hypothetical protein